MVAPFNKFYCKIWVAFLLITGKRFSLVDFIFKLIGGV